MGGLAQAAGHTHRHTPLKNYSTGLWLPGERKNVERWSRCACRRAVGQWQNIILRCWGYGTAVAGPLPQPPTTPLEQPASIGLTNPFRWYKLIQITSRLTLISGPPFSTRLTHGAQVIDVSIGGSSVLSTLQSAVDYAWSKGALLFAAAMNYSFFCPCYSAACNHALAVRATYNNHQLAGFSITATGSRSRRPDHSS